MAADELFANEEALRERERRFRTMANGTPVMLWVTDSAGKIEYINRAYCDFFGVTRDAVRAGGWELLIHPDDAAGYVDVFAACSREQRPFRAQARVRHHDGQWRWIDSQGQPRFTETGEFLGMAGSSLDVTERKQLEEELRRQGEALRLSEQRYRALAATLEVERAKLAATIDNLPVGIGIEDTRGNTLSLNAAGLKLHGFESEADMLTRLAHYREEFELCYLDGRPAPFEEWPASRALRGDFVKDYEVVLRNKREGVDRILSYSAAPVQNSQGETVLLSYVIQDMTERRRAGAALRESEERLRSFLDNTNDSVFFLDRDWRFRFANRRLVELQGIRLEDLIGKTIWEAFPRLAGSQVEGYYRKAMEERGPVRFEMGGMYTQAWYDVGVYPIQEGISIFAVDRTEQHRAEEALRESERRERARATEMEALMDAVPAIIWISRDAACSEMVGNRFGYEFLGMGPGANLSKSAPEEVVARQPFHNFKDGQPVPPEELPMQVAAASGTPAKDYTFDLVFEDGTTHALLGNVNPLFDPEGSPAGAVGAFVDITELRRLQAEQIEARAAAEVHRRLLEQREQERQGIARDIHDGPIQTLASTIFNLQFVKEAFPDPLLQVELNQIALNVKNAVRELREMVNDLRPPSLIRFGLARSIRMHVEDLRDRYLELEITCEAEDDDGRLSDQANLALFRIYQEAMNNVIRHAKASQVRVRYTVEARAFTLELADDGVGFEAPKDFSSLTGSGHYGLAGMKERAETVGGVFRVSSQPGRGTLVQVRGPLSEVTEKEERTAE
jgi:PAS domain S-box-containing protein